MKKTLFSLFVLLVSLSSIGQSVDLQFVESPLTDCVNNQFCGTIQLQGQGGADFIGIGSIRFNYDATVLGFNGDNINGVTQGMYIAENFDSTTTDPQCPSIPPFTEQAFDGTNPGDFLLTFVLLSPTLFPGQTPGSCPPINAGWVDVTTICFDILNPNGNPNLQFVGPQNGPSTATVTDETNFNSDTNDPLDKYDNGTFTGFSTPLTTICEGCTDPTACNYDATATIDDGTCNPVDCLGNCTGTNTGPAVVGSACNDGSSTTVNDVYNASCVCVGTTIPGCTDATACNYNASATLDNGSCNPADCEGNCTGNNTGPAIAGTSCDDGNPITVNDTYGSNCLCFGTIIQGCTNPSACNYFPSATQDDGSCEFTSCAGCTNASACNYDASATIDDGSCTSVDCEGNCTGNATGPAVAGTACDDGDPTTTGDIYDTNCNCMGSQIPGCTNASACNYNANATVDDGTCNAVDCEGNCSGNNTGPAVAGTACDDGDATTANDIYDTNCNCAGGQIPGCTDATACNYNPTATLNDGSCSLPDCLGNCNGNATGPSIAGTSCDDNDICTINDVYDFNCNCAGTFQDSDNDSVCDANDICPGLDDTMDADMDGTPNGCDACPNSATDDADNDNVCDDLDLCANGPEPGTPCDDGDPNTVNDLIDGSCNCTGVIDNSCTLEIPMQAGWNLISTYCVPNDLDMEVIFANIASNTLQVKDLTNTYVPSFNFNGIGDWDITSGYQVKVITDDTLVINGTLVDPLATPITLNQGWNLISYLLPTQSGPFSMYQDINGNIIQMKDLSGTFIPSFNFNDMGDALPTVGYQVKMTVNDIFIYDPANIGNP